MHTECRRRVPASVPLLAAGLAFFLSITSCGSGGTGKQGNGRTVPAVEAVQARRGALPLSQRLSGVVRAANQVGIYPQVSAIVEEVAVETGASVEMGEVLVRLRDTEFRERLKQARANERIAAAQLKRARAQAKEAMASYARFRALADSSLASRAELETAEAQSVSAEADVELAEARVAQARAAVDEQKENLAQTVVRAPIAGRVGNRDAEVGMLAGPSTRLFTLGSLDSVRIEVTLTDRMLAFIDAGQRAEVRAADASLPASLSRISPFLHPVAHSTEAELDLANPDHSLKPGMFVTVDVFYGESEEATLVPLSALYEHPGTGVTGVYVTHASLDREPAGERGEPQEVELTEPVDFEFVPVDVLAQGRMEAGLRGVSEGAWVITLGQNLLGGEDGRARVRPVLWERVEHLQRLQRENMMEEVIERQSSP